MLLWQIECKICLKSFEKWLGDGLRLSHGLMYVCTMQLSFYVCHRTQTKLHQVWMGGIWYCEGRKDAKDGLLLWQIECKICLKSGKKWLGDGLNHGLLYFCTMQSSFYVMDNTELKPSSIRYGWMASDIGIAL